MPPLRRLTAVASAFLGVVTLTLPGVATAGTLAGSTPTTTAATTATTIAASPTTTAPPGGSAPTTTVPGTPAAPSTTAPASTPTTLSGGPGGPATTTTTEPAGHGGSTTTTTTRKGSTTTTTDKGVPSVPVGGPPTTVAAPGSPPAPQPDPTPILLQVQQDLDQLTAISDYQPAESLVAAAQARVTVAGSELLSARQVLAQAQQAESQARTDKLAADDRLRQFAVAAYVGVGYTTPGLGAPAGGNGSAGAGTVSTPGGLTGVEALDAKEMLILVGQRARQGDSDAKQSLGSAEKAVSQAQVGYQRAESVVTAAESNLLAAQQTLKLVSTAAVTPGAASATPLPDLLAAARTGTAPASTSATAPQDAKGSGGVTAGGSGGGDLAVAETGVGAQAATSPTILGAPVLDANELAAWYASTGRQADTTVPIPQLAGFYAAWGQKLGVRYDLAFAQSVVETGYFSFPAGGQLTAKDNNFAGIGACDTCAHGWSFPDAETGVQAQLELLHEYASTSGLPKGVKNVIGGTGIGGCCSTWVELAGHWASSTVYGISIMTIYNQMLTWLIPQQELAVGLIAPTPATAEGPELAPLPGATKAGPSGLAKPASKAGAGATTTTTTPVVSAAGAGAGTAHH